LNIRDEYWAASLMVSNIASDFESVLPSGLTSPISLIAPACASPRQYSPSAIPQIASDAAIPAWTNRLIADFGVEARTEAPTSWNSRASRSRSRASARVVGWVLPDARLMPPATSPR